jgi:hypothetical protein
MISEPASRPVHNEPVASVPGTCVAPPETTIPPRATFPTT